MVIQRKLKKTHHQLHTALAGMLQQDTDSAPLHCPSRRTGRDIALAFGPRGTADGERRGGLDLVAWLSGMRNLERREEGGGREGERASERDEDDPNDAERLR